ncbi:MAG: succinylglutamate desuccinylase/aspartoacylase family protein [Bdellovibrionales bacterium]|nr:succinylglutamate desuccinylase/aspartoacylase family protein [Bdellovibrionales bacterium]
MDKSTVFSNPDWAQTRLGTSIEIVSSQPLENVKEPILLIGGVHGDEPEGVELVERTLARICAAKKSQWKSDWVAIPVWNVDGYKSQNRVNAGGVDLNRNFPSPNWSTEAKAPRYFPGESAASEPETRALVKLIQDIRPRLIIHCHSWEPCIVYTADHAPKEAEILAETTGYRLSGTIGYDTPGSLGQWGWHTMKTPVICIEEQEKVDLSTIWPRFASAMERIFLI